MQWTKCPIGLYCDRDCRNYYYCNRWTKAWLIPYQRSTTCLVVRDFAYVVDWVKELTKGRYGDIPDRCEINSDFNECGWYRLGGSEEDCDRIFQSWIEAGYHPAIPLKNKPPNLDDLGDCDIPF